MALQLQINVDVSRDCGTFLFSDSTPVYDALINTGGYDINGVFSVSPNDLDTSKLKLEVTNLATPTVTKTITIPSTYFNATRIPGVVQYTINSTTLGSTIVDGVYKFIYTVVDTAHNNRVYQAGCYILNDCNICCSLDKKLKDLKNCGTCNDKNNRTVNMLYEAYMLRQKAHHLVSCHDFTGAMEVLEYLNTLLDIKTCDNCN